MPPSNFSTHQTVAVSLTLLVLLCTGCASDSAVIGQSNQVHGSIEPAVIRDPEVQRYMDAVGDRIVEAAIAYNEEGKAAEAQRGRDSAWMYDGSVRFHLVNSKTLNAFTTGGPHVYIYNQLFQDAKSEDELAAVMAHEFAHIYARHVHSGMNRQYGVLGATLAGAAVGYVAGGDNSAQYAQLGAGGAGALATFFAQGYTREDENEADKLGFRFYVRAGWDPERFADFFKQMIDKGYDRTPELASDHPSLRNRVTATEERIDQLSRDADRYRRRPIAEGREFREIQARALEVARNTPDDNTLAAAQLMLQAFPSCVTPEDQPEQKVAQERLMRAAGAEPETAAAVTEQDQPRRRRRR